MTQNRLCTIYNVLQRKIVNHVKIAAAAAAAAATNDGDGCLELLFLFFFLAIFYIDFFFFISVLCCTEVYISLDFCVIINFFMKPTIVIGYGILCLIECFV